MVSAPPGRGGGGWLVLGLIFAGYVPLASQSPTQLPFILCPTIDSILGARGPRMCRPTLEMPATCEKNLWYPGYPIQITLLKMPPHGEMPFATSYSNSKTVQFDLSDYQELVIGQVKSDSQRTNENELANAINQ